MSTEFETTELKEANNTFSEFISFLRDLIIILIVIILMRIFVITPFRINGTSMEESYHEKEYILVDKFSYLNLPDTYGVKKSANEVQNIIFEWIGKIPLKIGDPKRGDVVVITPHVDTSREYYIKRVIAIPGDTIRFEGGKVFIKMTTGSGFVEIKEPYLSLSNSGHTYLPESIQERQFTLSEGQYWVMGDNRQNSSDSRTCFKDCYNKEYSAHFIKRSDIIGNPLINFGYLHILKNNSWEIDWGNIGWVSAPRFLNHPRTASYPELGD